MGSVRRVTLLLPRLLSTAVPYPSPRLSGLLSSAVPCPGTRLPLPPSLTFSLPRPSFRFLPQRSFLSTSTARAAAQGSEMDPEEDKKLTLYERFKATYKTHGKILVAVHVCTSIGWFGGFFLLVNTGLDVIGLLEWLQVSEKLLGPVRSSAWVNVALAYLLYKLASPLRYMSTIGGTHFVVAHFRKTGKIPVLRDEDRLRNMAKEGQASLKERRENLTQRYQENRESLRAEARRRLQKRMKKRTRKKDNPP